jgi:hypothetical protein
MHDPMVVAFEIPSPIPHRVKWRERGGRRWGFDVSRRTNDANRGERTYPWWRLRGYTLRLAGRAYGLGKIATIWHNEPGERDSGDVCRHYVRGDAFKALTVRRLRFDPFLKKLDGGEWAADRRWKWHVHHWSIQIHALQGWRSRVFDRCTLCGRKGRPNISHGWNSKPLGWRKWRSSEGLYHSECSELVSRRRQVDDATSTMVQLFHAARVWADQTEEEAIARLYEIPDKEMSFLRRSQLTKALGWDFDTNRNMRDSDGYVLTHTDGREVAPYDLIRARKAGA